MFWLIFILHVRSCSPGASWRVEQAEVTRSRFKVDIGTPAASWHWKQRDTQGRTRSSNWDFYQSSESLSRWPPSICQLDHTLHPMMFSFAKAKLNLGKNKFWPGSKGCVILFKLDLFYQSCKFDFNWSDSVLNVLMEKWVGIRWRNSLKKPFRKVRITILNKHMITAHLKEQWNYLWFPGNATLITCHVFRIFDMDRNDYLDFKEFLLAIDVAMREIGAEINSTGMVWFASKNTT